LFVVSVVCCQVEVSATSWSLIQRSPTDCGESLCVIWKPQEWGGHDPRWVAAPQQKKIKKLSYDITTRLFYCLIYALFPTLLKLFCTYRMCENECKAGA